MPELERAVGAVLRALARPDVRGVAAWTTLAAVVADVTLAQLPTRLRIGSLIGALGARLGGWGGAILTGILHPLLLGGGVLCATLAATRIAAIWRWWWGSGVAGGLLLGAVVLLLQPGPLRRRLPGPLLVGIVAAAVFRWTGHGLAGP